MFRSELVPLVATTMLVKFWSSSFVLSTGFCDSSGRDCTKRLMMIAEKRAIHAEFSQR